MWQIRRRGRYLFSSSPSWIPARTHTPDNGRIGEGRSREAQRRKEEEEEKASFLALSVFSRSRERRRKRRSATFGHPPPPSANGQEKKGLLLLFLLLFSHHQSHRSPTSPPATMQGRRIECPLDAPFSIILFFFSFFSAWVNCAREGVQEKRISLYSHTISHKEYTA